MTSGLNHGVVDSLPHLLGVAIGFPLMVLAIGFGLGVIFVSYPNVHLAVKVLGVAYLLYLSYKIANTGNLRAKKSIRKPFTFLEAAIFQWVNPKAWVIGIGAIATFTTQGNVSWGVALVLVGYLTVGAASMLVWLLLGAVLQKLLTNRTHLKYFNWVMATLLVASVFSMVASEVSNS